MVNKLYVIRDIVAEEAGPVFMAKNDLLALRQYNNLLRQESVIAEDYVLYCVGEYDTEEMTIQPGLFVVEIPNVKEVEDEQGI